MPDMPAQALEAALGKFDLDDRVARVIEVFGQRIRKPVEQQNGARGPDQGFDHDPGGKVFAVAIVITPADFEVAGVRVIVIGRPEIGGISARSTAIPVCRPPWLTT